MLQPTLKTRLDRHLTTDDPVVLVAADENYVRPLAVTLLSAARTLRAGSQLRVIVLDGGIEPTSWTGLCETLVDYPVSLESVRPDPRLFQDLGISHHISHTAYFRLMAGQLLPVEIERVIYLDSDTLVQADLNQLWETNLHDHYCLAAVDIACPFVDADFHAASARSSLPWLTAFNPIPNWQSLGIDQESMYFNSGVMVLNLARWRREKIHRKLLSCLRENRAHVWCWDQYALNVVFANQWGRLESKWNQGAHVFEYPSESASPIPSEEFASMRDEPAIIHFTTEYKPWDFESTHPLRDRFFETLDETAWSGWRPEKRPFSLLHEWNQFAARTVRRFAITSRRLRYRV
jgi:lipopolysaccharide biosynthesis glycosyltransferase